MTGGPLEARVQAARAAWDALAGSTLADVEQWDLVLAAADAAAPGGGVRSEAEYQQLAVAAHGMLDAFDTWMGGGVDHISEAADRLRAVLAGEGGGDDG